MVEGFYVLPLPLLPCDPVNKCDTRYLKHSYKPIINPLKNPLNIFLYNCIFFLSPSLTLPPKFDYNCKPL